MNAAANPNILALRPDFRAIARWIEPNSTVLDAGCGDGSLLRVRLAEVSPTRIVAKKDDFGAVGIPQVYFTLPFPMPDTLRPLP